MARDPEYLKHLLEIEYGLSQESIDKFDDYRARLKGWMITGAAGVTAVAVSSRTSEVFWADVLLTVFFAVSEMYYIDIQEDVMRRNRELDSLIDSMSRGELGPEHEEYVFGLGKAFGPGRWVKLRNTVKWAGYRTFSPALYLGLLILMSTGALLLPLGQ